jgi:hypothetical protein
MFTARRYGLLAVSYRGYGGSSGSPTQSGLLQDGEAAIAKRTGKAMMAIDSSWARRSGPAVHPGEILREDFLTPLHLTAYGVAKALGVPRTRIERLAREETLR